MSPSNVRDLDVRLRRIDDMLGLVLEGQLMLMRMLVYASSAAAESKLRDAAKEFEEKVREHQW